jgi:Zinc finger, C2H2 type
MGLKVHHIHKHSKEKNFSCFCGKAFSLKETLKTHIKNVHKGERKFACSLCSKRFGQAVRLRDHFNNYHGSKQEIPCTQCNKVFHSTRNLKAHQIYHAEPQFKCNTCGKKFYLSNKVNLKSLFFSCLKTNLILAERTRENSRNRSRAFVQLMFETISTPFIVKTTHEKP